MPGQIQGRGAFIVLEGVDRSGKSTQARILVDRLNSSGAKAELWTFPDRTTGCGQLINSYLKSETDLNDAAVHLLFSANRWEKRDLLLQKLQEGVSLVVDRYVYSGAAFTAAKKVDGLSLQWCKAPDQGLPAPDAVVFLDLSIEQAQKRGGFGEERYEKIELQREVRRLYHLLSEEVPQWTTLSADQSREAISEQVYQHALEVIETQQNRATPPALLWQ